MLQDNDDKAPSAIVHIRSQINYKEGSIDIKANQTYIRLLFKESTFPPTQRVLHVENNNKASD